MKRQLQEKWKSISININSFHEDTNPIIINAEKGNKWKYAQKMVNKNNAKGNKYKTKREMHKRLEDL